MVKPKPEGGDQPGDQRDGADVQGAVKEALTDLYALSTHLTRPHLRRTDTETVYLLMGIRSLSLLRAVEHGLGGPAPITTRVLIRPMLEVNLLIRFFSEGFR